MITAILIDDEASARNNLIGLLQNAYPDIEVVAQASSIPEGVKEINKHNPDIVFLDIEMPGYSGFQLFDFIDKPSFETIFVTGHSGYALQAFEVSAIGYLLKPVKEETLAPVIKKAIALRQQLKFSERLEVFKDNMAQPFLKRIALPVANGYEFISPGDIIYLQADGAYTKLFIREMPELLISKKLIYFENLLAGNPNFFRSHRSFVINLPYVKAYNKSEGGFVVMKNNHQVSLAKERTEEFIKAIEKI